VKTIKRHIWDPYRSVAHLWAATHAWELEGRLPYLNQDLPIDDSGVRQYLALTELFRERGEQWAHEKGPPILDPGEMWRVSPETAAALPSVCYCFYPPDESLLKAAAA
jgi:hypothetical protein